MPNTPEIDKEMIAATAIGLRWILLEIISTP
jgi:hypothetical protein